MILLFLGIYSSDMKSRNQTDTCTPIFAEASFTTAKICQQPTCLLMDEWVKLYNISTVGYYPGIKKNKILSFLEK